MQRGGVSIIDLSAELSAEMNYSAADHSSFTTACKYNSCM